MTLLTGGQSICMHLSLLNFRPIAELELKS